MDDAATKRQVRAEARRQRVTLVKTTVTRDDDDLCAVVGEEAMALVATLTASSWALMGGERPTYSRAEIPVRFVPREPR